MKQTDGIAREVYDLMTMSLPWTSDEDDEDGD